MGENAGGVWGLRFEGVGARRCPVLGESVLKSTAIALSPATAREAAAFLSATAVACRDLSRNDGEEEENEEEEKDDDATYDDSDCRVGGDEDLIFRIFAPAALLRDRH